MNALVSKAVEWGVKAIGAALVTERASDALGPPPTSQPYSSPSTSSTASADDLLDPYDPNASQISPTGTGNLSANPELHAAATANATTCQDCPVCGFMVNGKYVTASVGFRPAADYQDRVVRLVAMNNLPFMMQPNARQNEEWQLPDPAIGQRKLDGFAALPCMLIEAKLGYSGYLIERFVSRSDAERVDPIAIEKTAPIIDRRNLKGAERMAGFLEQMRGHNTLARQYPARPGSPMHTVAWCHSNPVTAAFSYAQIRMQGLERLKSFYVPIGILPPSRWTIK